MEIAEVAPFLTHLPLQEQVTASIQNPVLSAIVSLYRVVLHLETFIENMRTFIGNTETFKENVRTFIENRVTFQEKVGPLIENRGMLSENGKTLIENGERARLARWLSKAMGL